MFRQKRKMPGKSIVRRRYGVLWRGESVKFITEKGTGIG